MVARVQNTIYYHFILQRVQHTFAVYRKNSNNLLKRKQKQTKTQHILLLFNSYLIATHAKHTHTRAASTPEYLSNCANC